MTTYKELVKMYSRKDPKKYEIAIAKNRTRYRNEMDELIKKGMSDAVH